MSVWEFLKVKGHWKFGVKRIQNLQKSYNDLVAKTKWLVSQKGKSTALGNVMESLRVLAKVLLNCVISFKENRENKHMVEIRNWDDHMHWTGTTTSCMGNK